MAMWIFIVGLKATPKSVKVGNKHIKQQVEVKKKFPSKNTRDSLKHKKDTSSRKNIDTLAQSKIVKKENIVISFGKIMRVLGNIVLYAGVILIIVLLSIIARRVEKIYKIMEDIRKDTNSIKKDIVDTKDHLDNINKSIPDLIKSLTEGMKNISKTNTYSQDIKDLSNKVEETGQILNNLQSSLDSVRNIYDKIDNIYREIAELKDLRSNLDTINNSIRSLKDNIYEYFNEIKDGLRKSYNFSKEYEFKSSQDSIPTDEKLLTHRTIEERKELKSEIERLKKKYNTLAEKKAGSIEIRNAINGTFVDIEGKDAQSAGTRVVCIRVDLPEMSLYFPSPAFTISEEAFDVLRERYYTITGDIPNFKECYFIVRNVAIEYPDGRFEKGHAELRKFS